VIPVPKTPRGRATRERIVTAAADLIQERGVAETSIEDVLARAGASKSQLYHYFDDRAGLLRAIVAHNARGVLDDLPPLESWTAMRSWLDALVDLQVVRHARGGCPIGSLVSQLAESDDQARLELATSLERWRLHLRDGLSSMQAAGKLDRRADADELATATLAAIQGGLLLTQASRNPGRLKAAVDAAYAHLRAYAPTRRHA
jgi:TetR/AcrR family transcriptional regulator, transcriptional repressor for nem operon